MTSLGRACLLMITAGLYASACPSSKGPHRDRLPVARVWTSEHFRYSSRADDMDVCEGVVEHMERHFEALHDYLGFDWPSDARVDYFKFRDAADARTNSSCSALNASCFIAGVGVQSAKPFERHELIHAYVAAIGDRHRLLEEGLADALSCGHELRKKPEAMPVQEAFAPAGWKQNSRAGFRALYDSAAWFVGWLLNEHGPRRFMRLFERCLPETDYHGVAEVFAEVYGSALAEAWAAAFDSEDPDAGCVRVHECVAPAFDEVPLVEACDHPGGVRSLTLQHTSWVVHDVGAFGSMLGACGASGPLPHHAFLDARFEGQRGEVFAYLLPPGRYFVTSKPDRHPIEVRSFVAERSCGEDTPIDVDFDSDLTLSVAPGLEPSASGHSVRWRLSKARRHAGYDVSCSPGMSASWCAECGDCAAACDTHVAPHTNTPGSVDGRVQLVPPIGQGGWVRLKRTF